MKRFNLKKFTFLLVILNIIFFIGLSLYPKTDSMSNANAEERDVYLNILTTNKFAYSIAKHIVGDKHCVQYMFKDGADCFNYKYTQDAINNVSNMDLFVYTGASFEPWIDTFISNVKKGKVGIINASRGTRLINYSEPKVYNQIEVKTNPYYWLNPNDLKISIYNIKSSIQEKDPKNRELYEQNYDLLLEHLNKSLKDFNLNLDVLENEHIFLVNDELDYLMKYMDLNYEKLKLKDLDSYIEAEHNLLEKSDDKNKKIGQDNKSNVIIFTDKNLFDKYREKLKAIGYNAILFIQPNSIDDYLSSIVNLKSDLLKVYENTKSINNANLNKKNNAI